uniref:Uncharacterized protein n=1 Tax=Parascaris equorum TaxID=6256 RepID=A0A914RZP8_PAREQ
MRKYRAQLRVFQNNELQNPRSQGVSAKEWRPLHLRAS